MGNLSIETQIRSLTKLLNEIKEGYLQVPPFQRDFVWSRDDIKSLFDSIKNNYPIGSILLWNPKRDMDFSFPNKMVGGFEIPQRGDERSMFILDGYQRLSALFGCLTNPFKSELIINIDQRENFFDLYYDLEEDTFVYIRKENKPYQIPIYILMSTIDFRQYYRNKMENRIPSDKLEVYLDRADAFSRSLIDYKLAVIEISDATLSEAVNIFARINSKGTDISYDWMINALSYRKDFNFSNEIDELKNQISEYNYYDLPRNMIFRCYQSAFDDKLYIDQTRIEELAVRADFIDRVKEMTPCIVKAVDFLYKQLNVVDYRLVPYNIQLVFLSVFFLKVKNPTQRQYADLKKWFWFTTYSNYFTLYSLANQRRAFRQFLDYIYGEVSDPIFIDDNSLPFQASKFPSMISLSSVRSKSLILFELYNYRTEAGKAPLRGGLNMKKIYIDEPRTPENTLVCFSSKRLNETLKNLHSPTLFEIENPAFFLPEIRIESSKKFLHQRKEMIQSAEEEFVKDLGIEYRK